MGGGPQRPLLRRQAQPRRHVVPFGHLQPDLRIDPLLDVGLLVGARTGRTGPQLGSRNAAQLP